MSELKTNLQEILQEKQEKIIPENIKKDVTIFDITGTYEGSGSSSNGDVKLFETVEEMNLDMDKTEGDLAVVYRNETQNMSNTTETQYITFPETVTLSEAFTGSAYAMLRAVDTSSMFDGNIRLSKTSFRFDGYSESGMIRVQYSSSDGITYTRTRFSGDSGDLTNPVDLGTVVKCYDAEEWDDAMGYFMQTGENIFNGLYECKLGETPNYDIKQINLDGSITEIDDTISIDIVNTGIVKSYIAFGNPINYYPKVYIDTSRKNLIIYSSGSSSLYISTNSSYQNKILDSYSSNVSTDVFTKYCIFNIENKTTELKDLDIIGVATTNDDNIVNIPYQFFIGGFSCYDSSSGNVTVDNNVYSIEPNNFNIYKTDTSFSTSSSVIVTKDVGNPNVHLQLQYFLCTAQLNSVANCVYESIFYGKNGVELGTLTQNVSNQFTDMNAEVYAKIQSEYDKLEPRILTDEDKEIDKTIHIIPSKTDGTPLIDASNLISTKSLFKDCYNLSYIISLDVTNSEDLSYMYNACFNLKYIYNITTGDNVTTIQSMFGGCTNLKAVPTMNISNVENIYGVFDGCKSLIEIPLMDTTNVTTMDYCFAGCDNLVNIPVLNLSKVTSMIYAFKNCPNLSDESLDNILTMCTNATSYSGTKTLKYIGLTEEQATKCQSLSNYTAFTEAGWTTGY